MQCNAMQTHVETDSQFTLDSATTYIGIWICFLLRRYGTGRAADTSGLNLSAVDVTPNARSGKIATDKGEAVLLGEGDARQPAKDLFAIGDVADLGKVELTPVAIQVWA